MRLRIASLAGIWLLSIAMLPAGVEAGPSKPAELADLNRATVPELMQVPGLTAAWAGRIVRFRPYRSKLDLLDQGVVTPEVYRRIRDHVIAHRLPVAPAKR